jgi:hypothetical protein
MDITDASGAAADAAGGGYGSGTDSYSGDSSSSGAVEGDYGFAVFSAIDKVEAGQPLTRGELQTLTDAGLGGMTAPSGRTVSEELSASSGPSLTGQQIHDILYGSFPNFSNINFGNIGSLFGPPAPVDDSGVGGVDPNEFKFNEDRDYGVFSGSEGVTPVDESGPGGVGVSEERTVDYGVPLASEGAAPTERTTGSSFWSRFGRVSAPAPVTVEEVEELPEDEEAEFQSVLSPPYGQLSPKAQNAYVDALAKGLSDDEAYIEALRTEDQELAFEDKIQQLAAKEFVPTTPATSETVPDRSAGFLYGMEDRPVQFESQPAPVRSEVATVNVGPPAPTTPSFGSLEETGLLGGYGVPLGSDVGPPAPTSINYDRSLVFGDRGYGEGMTGAQTGVFDRTLNETGDVGAAVRAAAEVQAPSTGQGLGAFGRRGGFGGGSSFLSRLGSSLRDAVSTPATPAVDEQPLVDPLPPNVVGTGTPGGMLVDERGEPVLSTSYGLPGEYAPSGPTLDPALLELAATARGMTVEELRAVIDAEIQGGSPVGTTGLSRETLEALQEKGFGGRDISPTQTVDQALASMQTNQFLTDYLPTIIGMVGPPGTGALLSGVRTIGDLMQGKLSPGAAMTRELIGLLARQANIPASVLTNILEGKFGDAAANQAKSFMFNTLAQEAGVQGSAIGMIANELGFLNPLTGQIDRAVTQVIPDQNFGIPGRVAAGLDEFVGPIQGAVSQGLGALGDAAQTGLTGLGNVLGQIGQGVQTGVGAITGGIGDLVNTITGGGTPPIVPDDSGVGGVDPDEFEFIEDRIYDTGTDVASGIDADVNAGIGSVVDETGPGGTDQGVEGPGQGGVGIDPGGGTGGYDEYEEFLGFTPIVPDDSGVGGIGAGTGSVGLPGEELGEGILTGVDPWDQALIDADTGGVYDLDTGTGADTVTNVGGVGGVGTDTGGGDTDTVVQPPPPVIPPTGGGTAQPYGSYFARVPTGYQVVQGLYGPIMQYTYGNLPLGGA